MGAHHRASGSLTSGYGDLRTSRGAPTQIGAVRLLCAACGVAAHVPDLEPLTPTVDPVPAPRKFAALYNRDCRTYLVGAALAMMADNIEHVITYWVLWQKFHSPALSGFQVISHWMPFLLLSVYFGGLADRYDCRRVIQAAQALFMLVSVAWGVLFVTGGLQVWEACLLLVLHGMAGSLWGPGEQLMLHDFVGTAELPSAVRLNATFRSLGILFGPVVGLGAAAGAGRPCRHLHQCAVLPAADRCSCSVPSSPGTPGTASPLGCGSGCATRYGSCGRSAATTPWSA